MHHNYHITPEDIKVLRHAIILAATHHILQTKDEPTPHDPPITRYLNKTCPTCALLCKALDTLDSL